MFWGQLNVPRPRPQTLKNPCVLPSCRLALESDESIFTCDVTQGEEGCLQPYVVNFQDQISCDVFLRSGQFLHNSRDSITILKFSTFLVWRKPAQVHILRLKMGLFVVSIQDGRHGVVVHRVRALSCELRGSVVRKYRERAHIIVVGTYTFNFKDLLWDISLMQNVVGDFINYEIISVLKYG